MFVDLSEEGNQVSELIPSIFSDIVHALKYNKRMPEVDDSKFTVAIAGSSPFDFKFAAFDKIWMLELDRAINFEVIFRTEKLEIRYHENIFPSQYMEFVLVDRVTDRMFHLTKDHLCKTQLELVMRSLNGDSHALLGAEAILDIMRSVSNASKAEHMPGFNFSSMLFTKYRLRKWYYKCTSSPTGIKLL